MSIFQRHILFYLSALVILITFFITSDAAAQIACLSGFVYDTDNNPVVDADLDFDDAETGERIYTPDDDTDEYGFYRVCVLAGNYHISFAPSPGTHLLGRRFMNYSLNENQELDVTLESGLAISGTITDFTGNPIGGVDIDVDSLAGGRVYTPNDNSDSVTGEYWIVVPSESYRLRFQPPAGTRWLGRQLDTVIVHSDTNISVTLEEGMLLTGLVTDSSGQGLDSIRIDLRDQVSGEKLYVANNKTDSTGHYCIAVSTGLFSLRFEPPSGNRLVGVAVDSFSVASDTVFNQVLTEGLLVSAYVADSSGNSIEFADIDFIQENTDIKIYTPHDKTDSAGLAVISVPPDIYKIRADPPIGLLLERAEYSDVVLQNDTALYFVLPEVQRVSLSGKVVNSTGTGLQDIEVGLIDTLTKAGIDLFDNSTDSTGIYHFEAPRGGFIARLSPPSGSRYTGKVLGNVAISQDTLWDDIVLDTGLIFTAGVFDYRGLPIEGVDFDFISEITSEEIFTPHDSTGVSGFAVMTIHPGTYTVRITPPDGSLYNEHLITGFDITADTSAEYFLTEGAASHPAKFILNNNYPNPFNTATSILYVLLESSNTSISIYNMLGQVVMSANQGFQSPGHYMVKWNGTDNYGMSVASGVYYYQLKTGSGKATGKMTLLR